MSIQVYIRCAPQTEVRLAVYRSCLERWFLDSDCIVKTIGMRGSLCDSEANEVLLSPDDFQWTSRRYAEEHASGPYYILCDDDTLILGADWAKRAVEMARHENFALLSGNSVIAAERHSSNTDFALKYCTGCPCVIRKGWLDLDRMSGPANVQDSIIGERLHEQGLKSGVAIHLDYIHAGFGLSQVEPKLWLRY